MPLLRCSRPALPWALFIAVACNAGSALAQEDADQPANGETAQELVERLTEFYKGLEKFSVDQTYEMSFTMEGQEEQTYTDKRRITVWRPNRIAVRPLGESDADGEFVCDGTLLFASMPSLGRYVLLPAESEMDALLEHDASMALGVASVAGQLAGSHPLGDFEDAEVTYKRLETNEIDGVQCDGVEISAEGGGIVLWIERGEHPLVRKYEWKMPQAEEAEVLGMGMTMPVISFDNWQVEPDLTLEAFAYDIPEGLEPATSLMEGYMDELELDLELEMEEDAEDDEWPDPTDPIPQNEEAITTREVAEQKLAYNRRTLVDAYREHGKHDPKWDEPAVELLEEMARHFSSTEGFKSREEILDLTKPLLNLGCDDPMVKYCHAAMILGTDRTKAGRQQALDLFQESYVGLKDSGYPANRRLACADSAWEYLARKNADKQQIAEAWRNLLTEFPDTIAMQGADDVSVRDLYSLINNITEKWSPPQKAQVYEQVKPLASEHPFLVNMVGGDYHMAAAWAARGGGWASEVTDEGWQSFADHVAEARACYEKAAEEPGQPEAAAALIKVAMASSPTPAGEMRYWFDRAVEVQIDYAPAYVNLVFGYSPRWHGSFGLMYQFGLECKNTDRYDTSVPYKFCDTLWRIANDSQNSAGLTSLNRPGLYENTHEVCRRYIQHYTDVSEDPDRVDWWGTIDFGFAYCTEHWQEAAHILDQTGDVLHDDALSRFPLNGDQAIAEVRLRTSPRAGELGELLAEDAGDTSEEHLSRLESLADDESLHSSIRSRVRSQLQRLRWQSAFEAGKTVSLTADEDLSGWTVVTGTWQSNASGGLDGVSHTRGIIVRCETYFGNAWELTGKWRYGKSPYAKWDAGIIIFGGDRPLHSVTLNPTKDWVAAGPFGELDDYHRPLSISGEEVSFRLRLDNGVVSYWVNDEQVITDEELPGWRSDEPIKLALGARYRWAGSELSFRNLTIKPLDDTE